MSCHVLPRLSCLYRSSGRRFHRKLRCWHPQRSWPGDRNTPGSVSCSSHVQPKPCYMHLALITHHYPAMYKMIQVQEYYTSTTIVTMQFVTSIHFPSNINEHLTKEKVHQELPLQADSKGHFRQLRLPVQNAGINFRFTPGTQELFCVSSCFWFYAFAVACSSCSVPCQKWWEWPSSSPARETLANNGESQWTSFTVAARKCWNASELWYSQRCNILQWHEKGQPGGKLWNPPHLILEPSLFSLGSLGRVWKLLGIDLRILEARAHVAWNGHEGHLINPAPVAEGNLDRVDAKPCLLQGCVSTGFDHLHLSDSECTAIMRTWQSVKNTSPYPAPHGSPIL